MTKENICDVPFGCPALEALGTKLLNNEDIKMEGYELEIGLRDTTIGEASQYGLRALKNAYCTKNPCDCPVYKRLTESLKV